MLVQSRRERQGASPRHRESGVQGRVGRDGLAACGVGPELSFRLVRATLHGGTRAREPTRGGRGSTRAASVDHLWRRRHDLGDGARHPRLGRQVRARHPAPRDRRRLHPLASRAAAAGGCRSRASPRAQGGGRRRARGVRRRGREELRERGVVRPERGGRAPREPLTEDERELRPANPPGGRRLRLSDGRDCGRGAKEAPPARHDGFGPQRTLFSGAG